MLIFVALVFGFLHKQKNTQQPSNSNVLVNFEHESAHAHWEWRSTLVKKKEKNQKGAYAPYLCFAIWLFFPVAFCLRFCRSLPLSLLSSWLFLFCAFFLCLLFVCWVFLL
jgi:hypothetical protein